MRRKSSTAEEVNRVISDLKFEIGETATAEADSRTPRAKTAHGAPVNANADPSFLFSRGREAADKGVRGDSFRFFP
jgi:hypothetical protein